MKESVPYEQIKAQAKLILNSEAFKEATRLRQFLGYIVDKYCEGATGDIKQYAIGVEAFGFGNDFDPQKVSVVRMEAGRLRRRLSHYYVTEGINDQLLIEVPKGSYIPLVSRKTTVEKSAPIQSELQSRFMTTPLTGANNPTIAVIHFRNISSDDGMDYFADGLTEEITSVLSLTKDFSIVPPLATKKLSASQASLDEIRDALNVQYVLEGSIRKVNDYIRITTRLSDTSSGHQLWSGEYNSTVTFDNILNIQDEIATAITTSVANEYSGAIPRKVAIESSTKDSMTLTTYEAILRLHHYNLNGSPARVYNSTLGAVERAIENDQNNAMLLCALAEIKLDGYAQGWSEIAALPATECQALLDTALSLDRDCAYAYFVLGLLKTNQRNPTELLTVVAQLSRYRYSPTSLAQAGWFLALAGKFEEGIELLNQQLELLQYYPGWFRHVYFLYHYTEGRYEEALTEANQFDMPGLLWDPVERAAALGQLGRIDEGRKAIHELLALYPDFFTNPRRYLNCYIMFDDLVDDVLEGLEKVR
jgi:TolB-like protein